MAIFNKINKHSKAVGIAIGVGLLLFMVGSEVFGPNSLFKRSKNDVGEINGHTISYEEYNKEMARIEQEYMIRSGKSITENERASLQEQAWNDLIIKYAYQPQYDKLGVQVTKDEILDMVQGKNIHPIIKQLFSNPQTQQFDKSFLTEFLRSFDKREPRDQQLWTTIENGLPPERMKAKYIGLFKYSNYVTKEEAKREYLNQSNKAQAKFVYVSYYSVPDSTVQVTDSELKDYIDKNKEKYKVEAGRSLEYVTVSILPSGKDSAIFKQQLQELTKDFKTTDNDSLFVANNSDNNAAPKLVGMGELPEELKSNGNNLQFDSVYGPFSQGPKFVLYKVLGTQNDTVYSARASHILFKPEGPAPEAKAKAQQQANEVLERIKKGENFEIMAATYGTDGTKTRGGDLGWFSEGQMVKPFNDAVFNASSKGLMPKLVETDFGYHIIKVAETKTNKKYLLASVERDIVPTDETRDLALKKADSFAGTVHDTAEFHAEAKKDPSLVLNTAKNIRANDRYLNAISSPREIIRWAFNDADIDDVSQVFSVDNAFVVAILTGKRDKGTASVDDVRDEVTVKVRNEKKGDVIIEKLNSFKGGLDKIASSYGSSAVYNTANDLTFAASSVPGMGYEPIAVGKIFGLQKGKRSEPFKGETGVAIVELENLTVAPEIADYTSYKTQLLQQRTGREDYSVDEAIKENSDIKDERYKFF